MFQMKVTGYKIEKSFFLGGLAYIYTLIYVLIYIYRYICRLTAGRVGRNHRETISSYIP